MTFCDDCIEGLRRSALDRFCPACVERWKAHEEQKRARYWREPRRKSPKNPEPVVTPLTPFTMLAKVPHYEVK